jgi:hypothetical protein
MAFAVLGQCCASARQFHSGEFIEFWECRYIKSRYIRIWAGRSGNRMVKTRRVVDKRRDFAGVRAIAKFGPKAAENLGIMVRSVRVGHRLRLLSDLGTLL